jgi:hypothetical protein
MGAIMICVAVATLGIDVGWQQRPDGGMVYLIQLEPQTLAALQAGQPIDSDIPKASGEVRSFRITMGDKKLPRDTPPATSNAQTTANTPPNTLPQLPTNPAMKSLVQPSSATEGEATSLTSGTTSPGKENVGKTPEAPASDPSESGKESGASSEKLSRPWLPLTCTLFGLFASFGGNLFLGWIFWDLRKRHQSILARTSGV